MATTQFGNIAFIHFFKNKLRPSFILVLTIVYLFNCHSPHVEPTNFTASEDTTRYENLILSVAHSNPDLESGNFIYRDDGIENKWEKERIVKYYREIKNSLLGFTMRFHKWDGGQNFPKCIVYISDNKKFEYAFPFVDEKYYWEMCFFECGTDSEAIEKRNSEMKSKLEGTTSFETQINYSIARLGLNKDSKKKELNLFITLLADSLLQMKEYALKDTDELMKFIYTPDPGHTNKHYSLVNFYAKYSFKNINEIIADLKRSKNQNIRYFRCSEGRNGFWRIGIEERMPALHVYAAFVNKECYYSLYW